MRPPSFLLRALALLLLLPRLPAVADGSPEPADIAWLRRDGFGLDTAAVDAYRSLGRQRMLDLQLQDRMPGALPPAVAGPLADNPAMTATAEERITQWHQEEQRLQSLPEGEAKAAARNELQRQGNRLAQQARAALLLQAVYGPNQLKEQMVWFWLNHFSVYAPKGRIRWEVGDYAEHVIRPHALGRFRDLVLATLKSPAMLEYLDNVQNAKGHVNENYARELLELHTLGVDAGYTQQDVQQLALILTGVGLAPLDRKPRQLPPDMAPLLVREGLFEFHPDRHDFRDKVLLGQPIRGRGFAEVEEAVDRIVREPACARFLSRKLAEYFVGDRPPPALVERMTLAFRRSGGEIAPVLRTLFESSELLSGAKFKDPFQFVVSAVRLAYDGRPVLNPLPMIHWLHMLGEPLFGRITPDGWPLDAASWSSSGQMETRFAVARAIGNGGPQLFTPEGGKERAPGFPLLTSRLYYAAVEPYLSAPTRSGLAQAQSQGEWNGLLLSSPDFAYR